MYYYFKNDHQSPRNIIKCYKPQRICWDETAVATNWVMLCLLPLLFSPHFFFLVEHGHKMVVVRKGILVWLTPFLDQIMYSPSDFPGQVPLACQKNWCNNASIYIDYLASSMNIHWKDALWIPDCLCTLKRFSAPYSLSLWVSMSFF